MIFAQESITLPVASALVRANLPEWCEKEIATMEELLEGLAV